MSNENIDTASAANRPEVDSIWLTPGSVKPIFLAASILLVLVGLFAFRPLMIAALVAAAWISIAWIGESREESDELPLN
ncbi:MAG: hypothetical protein ACPGWS_04750 [Solirubrobacterales bacterium]